MEKHEITGQDRILVGRKVKNLRKQGLVPGNIFGNKIESKNIQLDTKKFLLLYHKVGESALCYLKVDGEKDPRPVFINQITKNPVTGDLLHVAFHQVDLKQKVTAPVPILLVGEAQAEKDKLGIMVQQIDEIEIEALPADMPENISLDVSSLAVVGAHFSVSDIKLDSTKLEIKSDPETIVVQIEGLAKEEVAPVVAAPTEAEVAPSTESPATPTAETPKEAPSK